MTCAGMPSGKAHIEYEDVLAAQKAQRLSHSLLLDRPVRVRLLTLIPASEARVRYRGSIRWLGGCVEVLCLMI